MGSSSPSASTTLVKRFQSGGLGLSAKKPNHAKPLKNKVEKIFIIEKGLIKIVKAKNTNIFSK